MAGEHPELDALRDVFGNAEEIGRRIRVEVPRPLHPANQRLAEFLGAEVVVVSEVGVVGGRGMGHYIAPGDQVEFVENLIDYRHSIVQAHKRADADDETPEICGWCGCEIDVMPQPHRPGCEGIGKPRTSALSEREPTAREATFVSSPVLPDDGVLPVGDPVGDESRGLPAGASEAASRSESTGKVWSRKKVTPETALTALREVAAELGHTPSGLEWTRGGWRPAKTTFLRLFGSWDNAVERADLPTVTSVRTGGRRPAAVQQIEVAPAPEERDETSLPQPVRSRSSDAAVPEAPPVPLNIELLANGDKPDWIEKLNVEARRLERRALAFQMIADGLEELQETDA